MAYYPPYVPETYLLTMRYIPSHSAAIKRVEKVENKIIEKESIKTRYRKPISTFQDNGKGFYLDKYA